MKNFFRLIASLCLLGPLVSGVGPASAEVVTSDSCTEIFSFTATNLSGAAVAGEPLSIEVAAMQYGWQQWYSLDHAIPSAGVLNLCALTDAQLDTAQDDHGEEFDSQFESGDEISVSYLPQGSSVTQVYRHVLTASQATAANGKTLSTLPNLVVSASTQVPVSIKDSTGAVQSNAPWEIYEEITYVDGGDSWTDYQYLTYGNADASGVVQVAGLANGTYQLRAHPGDTPSTNSMQTRVSFTMSGGVATFADPNVISGVLTLIDANVKFRIVDQNSSPLGESALNEMSPYLNDEDLAWDTISRRSDGYFMASLPDKTSYELDVYAGGETGYVRTVFTIQVVSGVATYKKGSTTLPSNDLMMDKANVAFKAKDIAGDVVPWPGMSVFSAARCATEASITSSHSCDSDTKYLDSTRNGVAAAKLGDGTYWVSLDPWNAGFDSKSSLSKFTITNGVISSPSGFATRIAASDPAAVLGIDTLELSARAANFKANVTTDSGAVITGGWINSSPVCNGDCPWKEFENSWGDIDSSGRMGLYLPPAPSGTTKAYEVQVEPSERFSASAARITFTVTVNDAGLVTQVTPPDQLPNNVTAPANGFWTLRLPAPNISGTVLMPTGNDVAPYSSFDIQKWVRGEYNYSDDIPWMYADENGRYSGYFAPGKYLVVVNPPYDLANVADKEYEIVVTSSGGACLFDGTNSSTCASTIAPGSFDLRLATPNVSGVVTKGGATLTRSMSDYASVELRKWDSQNSYWDWERWSQVSEDGSYSFNIQTPGTYQVVVNPGYIEGYSSGYQYLVVLDTPSGLTFCKIPEPGIDTLSRATCGGNTATPGPLTANIALERSNLQTNVTVPSGFEGWVNASITKLFEVPGGFRYVHSAHLDLRQVGQTNVYTGYASLDDNNQNPAKYLIEFDSYSDGEGSLPLARTKSYVWAYNFDTSDTEIELCPEASYTQVSQTCASGRLLDSSIPMNTALTTGNLSGAVKTPTGEAVPHAWLQAQKWEQSSWSGLSYSWNWKDIYASANRDGAFALNIEDPGFYKLQTRQQWGGTLPLADSFTLIKVDVSGNWCVIEGEMASYSTNASPTTNTTCNLGRDNDPSDSVVGLTLKLKDPKVSGVVKLVSGEPAANAYIWIQKWNSTNNYYEYTDYASTNNEGKFYINPIDGDYQLEFNPGWQDRNTEIGYSKNLCVGASAPTNRPSSPAACSATHNLTEQFLGPNLKGIVCPAGETVTTCTEDGVRHSWVEVREKGTASVDQPDYWNWIRGTSTDSDGRFSLRLDPGTNADPKLYSLRVYPQNQDEQGVGKRVFVSIGLNECKIGDSTSTLNTISGGCTGLRIGLLSPNVSGTLTYNNTNVPSATEQQFMKHSWVAIYTENYSSYVSSTSTNWEGNFAARLDDGTYFVDAYSNSRFAARSTLQLTVKVVTVSGVTTVSWKYRNQNDSSYVTTSIAADFDYVPPNVRINLSPSLTSSHVILVKDLEPNASLREQPRRFVSDGILASGVLTKDKSYSIRVVPNYQETLTGTCEIASTTVTVSESEVFAGATADTINLTSCAPQ